MEEKYMVTAQEVLEDVRSRLAKIMDEPEEGWLKLVYTEMSSRLFPGSFDSYNDEKVSEVVDVFMAAYQDALMEERRMRDYSPVDDFNFCTEEEFSGCTNADEYRRFLRVWRREYIYEYMRLAREVTPFNTVGHVAGVHHIATFVGRQVARYETETDLGIVSAAAACHDLGKFGCVGDELKKVAHYHYYYTTIICERLGLPMIAHIAGNHSTWDLELENLSIESLLLIYADFRVRSHREDGVEVVNFYSLDESFDIILSKLENVDEAKRHRYEKVYMKLKDFESYLKSLGVETDPMLPANDDICEAPRRDPLLMGNEVTERLKHLAFMHNIRVMSIFNNESAFGSLLETARTENDAQAIRAYLDILDEYSQYMTVHEKLMALRFLYDQLSNREGDIRRKAAATMGKLIAKYRTPATKLIPDRITLERDDTLEVCRQYLEKIMYPSHRVTDQHRRWIRYTLKLVTRNIIWAASWDRKHDFIEVYLDLCDQPDLDEGAGFALMEAIVHIPYDQYTGDDMVRIGGLLLRFSNVDSVEDRAAVIRSIEQLSKLPVCRTDSRDIFRRCLENLGSMREEIGTEYVYLKAARNLRVRIPELCGKDREPLDITDKEILEFVCNGNQDPTSKLMRDNLKTATPWVIKTVNIDFLLDYVMNDADENRNFFLASHLSNLLKVSEKVTVRRLAGKRLVKIAEKLSSEQINEIVIELTRGLEIGDYQFSKYIPEYLGKLSMLLGPNETDEFIDELGKMIDSNNYKIASMALDTIGEILQDSRQYRFREESDGDDLVTRERFMLGLLLKGIANYNEAVSRRAFLVMGQYVFGSRKLTLDDKFIYYRYINKKLLTLINTSNALDINFYNNAATLNHIYRFVTEYCFINGEMKLPENNRIAFFPGTFDPFSSGHKGIVDAIRDKGFEVYLALDEFSWSKNTQPRMMRRAIITMTVASDPDVFLFLDDFPVNIANPADIAVLKNLFKGKDVYMVAGSDVIINASSYKAAPSENSIHTMNHIIFRRESAEIGDESEELLHKAYDNISGNVYELMLPPYLEDVSSTLIRDNIDDGRDISRLIDPVAQSYIYDNSMYLREPMYKNVLETREIVIEDSKIADEKTINEARTSLFSRGEAEVASRFGEYLATEGVRYTAVRGNDGSLAGMVAYHEIDISELFDEFKDFDIATYLREIIPGRILVIRGLYVNADKDSRNIRSLLMTEVVAAACRTGITYALYHSLEAVKSQPVTKVLGRMGFIPVIIGNNDTGIYAVDMKAPFVLMENMDTVIKSPFNTNEKVIDVLNKTHHKLHQAVANLMPGNLVLSFNAGIMNHKIMHMVTDANGVPSVPTKPRKLGPDMCVPFGKVLSNVVIPNTVTKTLHTEKQFSADMNGFTIKEYPQYATIDNQIRTIKSFNRPVILVDDLLHKGYRLKHLDPIMKANDIDIDRIIVGVLSGRGRDLMALQGRRVESAYYIPNMKSWFVESMIYPFIGGDSLETDEKTQANLILSINLMPPFAAPGFLYKFERGAAYELALTCLENTREIFKVLEEEYLNQFERQLTIRRLSDVIKQPRMPIGSNIGTEELSRLPSSYMDEFIDRLKRIRTAMM